MYTLLFLLQFLILVSCSTVKDLKNIDIQSLKTTHDSKPYKSNAQSKMETNYSSFDDKQFCYLKCPNIDLVKNILINHDDYIISYNKETKYADWVAYKINKNNLSGINKARAWKVDPKLPIKIALTLNDYKDAALVCNYDRGHQAPLADFSNSPNWERVNYLSNITPQKAELNRGPWNNLESKIRHLAKNNNAEVYVITGTYYTDKVMCKLPYAHIPNIIPNGYWKIITYISDSNVYRVSFIFDQQTSRNADFCQHKTSIKDIIKIAELKFNYDVKNENSKELLHMIGCYN